ncbi:MULTISPECIES: GspH/FimT family pseudopilin [Maricaulis]|uniref:General secretion pathway protein H n=1 Tax=Maricaulis maris (strain MCS10) TaxID=394221 RepID=Q0ASQ9_MARMM|nr:MULTISPECIES: GspH/FimT family pseudopilin [Maricaulis]ABI64678.1 general secretion pathway protein H [Maricaulis maris MCS10]MAC88108.1 type II secretion system protein GspH [Maricaulis sp.]
MPAGPTYRGRDAGISLIEILVGVSILAVVAFAVSLSMTPVRSPLQASTDALAARLQVASEEAIISGAPIGLVIHDFGAGYGFYRYVDRRWWPLADHPALQSRLLPDSVRLIARDAMIVAGDADTADESRGQAGAIPVIWFDPAGLTEPFRLRLEAAGEAIDLDWQASGGLVVLDGSAS